MANNLWPWDQRIQLVSATLEGFFSLPQLCYLVLYQRRSITVLCQKYQAILETFNKCMLKFWSWFLRLIPLASSAIHSFCVRRKISLNKETERTCCGCSTASDVKQMDGVSLVCLAPRAQNSVQGIKRGQKQTVNMILRSRESYPLRIMLLSLSKRCFYS